jgi:hypothetical protein
MKWLIRNIAITVGMAVARHLWHSYRQRRAAERATGRAAIGPGRK